MINSLHLDDFTDQFEQAQEEVLTYQLSEQIPSSPIYKYPRKVIPKINQKHKLGLLISQKTPIDSLNYKQINKNIKKIEAKMGRVIKIGSITFRSNFQCGNIQNVSVHPGNTFVIDLEKESNSNRISGWFYFSVQGIKGEAHFVIRGFTKSSSLYNQGMKVCYRDTKDIAKWRRGGSRIVYTYSQDEDGETIKPKYELRFSHFFKNNQVSCIQFAYCFPYGLKKLYHLINSIKERVEVSILTKSYNSQPIPLLQIGNKSSDKVIILSARVHPGQTVSSFIMEGFLKELVSDNQYGSILRSNYLFKIVPMLNPDGVLKGNYRFSGFGCDLNRKWKTCKQANQPEIYFMRDLIRSSNKEKKVIMYIDIHGHSRKKNVFFYGCCEKGSNANSKPKQFPFLMEKIYNAYKYENCCFAVQKDKEGTARITVWKDLKIDYVYTLESTFCGAQYGPNYLEADYEKIGKKLCEGMAIFFYDEDSNKKIGQSFKIVQKMFIIKKKACEELNENPQLLNVGQFDDSGSESEPEVGQIPQKERNPQTGLPRPQAFIRQNREQLKLRKVKNATKFLSQQSIRETAPSKIKSEIYFQDQLPLRHAQTPIRGQRLRQNVIMIQNQRTLNDKVEIKIGTNAINTFQLDTLRASSLYQKNVRVHSITRNNQEHSERSKRIVNPFTTQTSFQEKDKQERVRINLMHGREGAQYRRVRKMAEQSMKRDSVIDNSKMVKGPTTNKIEMDNSNNVAIAPRFYPLSQQKTRRTSLQSYMKKPKMEQFKRFSINGDELNVRCIGKHVYL